MTLHIQFISKQFSESAAPVGYNLDQKTLNTLVALLSYSLQVAITNNDLTPEMSNSADIKRPLQSDSLERNIKHAVNHFNGCIPESSNGVFIRGGGSVSAQQMVQLVADILQTVLDLMLVRESRRVLVHIDS